MTQRLRLAFDDAEAFRAEYERNMSAGGAFVHTDADTELREFVEVEIHLAFSNANLVLEAEIVHQMPGAVAVQFLQDTSTLRSHFDDAVESLESATGTQESVSPAQALAPPEAQALESLTSEAPKTQPSVAREVAVPRNLETVATKAPPRNLDSVSLKPPSQKPVAPDPLASSGPSLEIDADPMASPAQGQGFDAGDQNEATRRNDMHPSADDGPQTLTDVAAPLEPEQEVEAEFTLPGFDTDDYQTDPGAQADFVEEGVDLRVLEQVMKEDEAERAESMGQQAPGPEALPASVHAPDPGISGATALDAERRQARRSRAAVPARLETTDFHLDVHTRDLSESGVLISADASELPLGKEVKLRLQSPDSGEHIEVAGRVSRHIETDGTVAAVGVEFDGDATTKTAIASLVHDVRESIAQRQEAGISGVIEELGMPNLVQMLGTTSESGTLIASHGAEEGVIAFTKGTLRYSRLGALRSTKALSRMLAWDDGHFEFYSSVDALDDEDDPKPLDAAILEAVRQLDERMRMGAEQLDMSTSFDVDRSGQMADPEPSKIEEAVLDLAEAGFTLRRIIDVIPESDADILVAVHNLLDTRVLSPS